MEKIKYDNWYTYYGYVKDGKPHGYGFRTSSSTSSDDEGIWDDDTTNYYAYYRDGEMVYDKNILMHTINEIPYIDKHIITLGELKYGFKPYNCVMLEYKEYSDKYFFDFFVVKDGQKTKISDISDNEFIVDANAGCQIKVLKKKERVLSLKSIENGIEEGFGIEFKYLGDEIKFSPYLMLDGNKKKICFKSFMKWLEE